MPNPQLLASVKNSLDNGMTHEQISTQLGSLGWSSSDIEEAFAAVRAATPAVVVAPAPASAAPLATSVVPPHAVQIPVPPRAAAVEEGGSGVGVTPSVDVSPAPSTEVPSVVVGAAAHAAAPVPAPASATLEYGGFWLRVLAVFVDGLILFPVNLVLILFVDAQGLRAISGLVPFVLFLLYAALLESSAWQATPGKKVLGMRVTDVSGARISFLRAVARYISKILSAVILGFGFLMVGVTKRKQGLHDKIAGTLIVKSRSASALGIGAGLIAIVLFLSFLGWTIERQMAATSALVQYANLDAMQASNLLSIQIGLEMYHTSENKYPDMLSDLVGAPGVSVTQSQLQNPVTHMLEDYTVSADRQTYRLCTALSSTTTPFCVASPTASTTTTP